MIEQRSNWLIDPVLIFSIVSLSFVGALFIYSGGVSDNPLQVGGERFIKQIIWIVTGLLLLYFSFSVHTLTYRRIAASLYSLGILFLIVTLFIGKEVNGAKAWIGIGKFGIQPSEFMKLALVFFLANLGTSSQVNLKSFSFFGILLFYGFLPSFLVFLQHDLGTAILYPLIFFIMAFVLGVRLRYFLFTFFLMVGVVLLAIASVWLSMVYDFPPTILNVLKSFKFNFIVTCSMFLIALLAYLGWFFSGSRVLYWISYGALFIGLVLSITYFLLRILKGYQINRLMAFLDPYRDPQGSGWNIIQSLTAIGSGELFGKGYLQGTQAQYRFLPEQNTDFIFSTIGEEWGFLGSMAVFLVYFLLLFRSLQIAKSIDNLFVFNVCVGIIAIFFLHFLINIGMVLGMMPIIGIPLLFLSYGGSAMWMSMLAAGILLGAYQRRDKFPLVSH